MQICVNFNMAFVLLVGSRLIITNRGTTIDVGQMSAMLTYGMQILMSLMMLSMIYVILTMSAESAKAYLRGSFRGAEARYASTPVTTVKDGSVDFDGVSFKYSEKAEKFALSDINLHIRSGMTVGILGGTGSSKSTLVQLIPRLYDATEGTVRVGGVDVRDYDINTLRGQVAMVLQKNLLFSGTIKENLRWATRTRPTRRSLRLADSLRRMSSYVPSRTDTTRRSSREEPTSPAVRSSVSALRVLC